MNIGNTWVYSSGNGFVRIRITGTVSANGHIYFVFDQAGTQCTCAQGTFPPFLSGPTGPFRIDSTTGNLFRLANSSCSWHINEVLVDTLRIRVGNITNNSCYFLSCVDSNQQNVFGISRKTKFMGENIMTYFSMRRYALGIGLINSSKGCFFSGCAYNLLGCVIEGTVYGDTGFISGITQISAEIPDSYSLSQNYPNPFNPLTKIKFDVPARRNGDGEIVKITVFDILGKEIETLVNEELSPGTYEVDFEGSNLPSGVYFYELVSGNFFESKKMLLVK